MYNTQHRNTSTRKSKENNKPTHSTQSIMAMSPESPFVKQLNAKDERFVYKKTPRSAGGSTARWDPINYRPHHVPSTTGLSKESPFTAKADKDPTHFTRRGPQGWSSKNYKVIKATGAKGLTKEESPFYPSPKDVSVKMYTKKLKQGWNEQDYANFKLSAGTVSKQKNPLSGMSLGVTPRGRFGGLRNQRQWSEEAYKAHSLAPGVTGANGGQSPFKSMVDDSTPRTRVRNQYARQGRVGEFNMEDSLKSFTDNQTEANRIRKATNGHGKGGAGEAIFGGKKQPGAVNKRKMKGAKIYIDGELDTSGH